jgi:hypothetical protein
VTFLDDPEGTVLATVTAPIAEEELEPEEGEEGVEGEEGAEGEEAGEGEAADGETPAEAPAGDE